MNHQPKRSNLGRLLSISRTVQILEIAVVFLIPTLVLWTTRSLTEDKPILKQAVTWFANILMILAVWIGIKLRGMSWKSIGLSFKFPGLKKAGKDFLLSVLVLMAALLAFVIGSVIMANITGMPQRADMSGYEFIIGNPFLFFLTLAGVWIVSSFGEEVVYRGFLINRINELGGNSRWSLRTAVLISAIIFGLVHYSWGPIGIVQTGFMGLALGIAYLILKRNLWIVVLAHLYMDTILWLQVYFSSR